MKLPSLSEEEWISVLTLASRWRFLRVREIARVVLIHLDSLTSLEKICLGRNLSIPSWVVDGFVELVHAATITDEEALQIDIGAETTAYKLFRIRELRIAGKLRTEEEEIFKEVAGKLCSARTKVEEIFKEELDCLRTTEKMFTDSNANK
jgi:hypothetical protein